jgi:hypothetical protein
MTSRSAACSCGQLHLSIKGEPLRISMCHCLECQRRTGAVISNQARFRREHTHRIAPRPPYKVKRPAGSWWKISQSLA